MSLAVGILLLFGVASCWLGAVALLRLAPLGRIHAVGFVNCAAGGAIVLATWLCDGATPRTAKVTLIWVVLLLTGALSAHVTGRAVSVRDGDRR